jgi:CBS-domain-containing membrane protein
LIGVCVTKLFHLSNDYNDLSWLSASLSTAIAIVAMQITKTVHPPAGATALLPSTLPEIFNLSWYFLPVVLLSSALMLACALLINNIQRRYPVFWIAPPAPNSAQQGPGTPEGNQREEIAREKSIARAKDPQLFKSEV